ncbi:MAG: DUF5655 domain-containing protein [Candidatus Heimdallarchaeaceae archaeon]
MSNAKIFKISKNENLEELPGYLAKLEIDIQDIFEKNLLTLLGIRFIASGKIIVKSPKRRQVDILGLDDNNFPVIIELKRYKDQGIMNQGIAYSLHLGDHKGDFYRMVEKKLGKKVADEIDWSTIRIICIAGKYREHDKEAVTAMIQNIDLIEYKLYGDDVLLIDPVYIGSKSNYNNSSSSNGKPCAVKVNTKMKRRAVRLEDPEWKNKSIYDNLLEYVETLGDDIEIKKMAAYTAAKRMWNFVSFQALAKDLRISIEMKEEDVDEVKSFLPEKAWESIICDCKISIYKKEFLLLNFNINSTQEAEFTKPFIERSYERS